jgi:Glycosyltransferase
LKPLDIQGYVDDGSIELPGEVKDPVAFYENASVFVLPSYYREGLPRTILEALACGRPVITTDWTGCKEAIEDGVNGYLVPIKDSKALSQKMVQLCDREIAQEMGNRAYRICQEKYEVGLINKQMRDVIGY